MKHRKLVASLLPVIGLATVVGLTLQSKPASSATAGNPAKDEATPAPPAMDAQVARGKYMVTVCGCNDCHTPLKMGDAGPEPDYSRRLSGHPESLVMPPAPKLPPGPWNISAAATLTAWSGPWGVSFTANLTPDKETGLGEWTARTFRDTIRTGRHQGRGRVILPPMPIPMYKNLTDEDLNAIFAYLQSIPAIRNKVPEPLPPPEASASAP
jgi:mono/diheme cytochrome c family protein